MKRLLITGAAGTIGSVLRKRLTSFAEIIRVSDIAPLGEAAANEECVTCDLADAAAVDALVEGCDGIVHMGGINFERSFETILAGNIVGVYNLFEAARRHGMPRILFASSNHTVGYYPQGERLGPDAPMRPDGLYGVSKCYGEVLARMYFDKFGQETALVRIGSFSPEPREYRMLSTWFAHDDLVSLVDAVFKVPVLGCPVIWGVSANDASWWDNSHLDWLGWQPTGNAEAYRDKLAPPEEGDPLYRYQGAIFTQFPIVKS